VREQPEWVKVQVSAITANARVKYVETVTRAAAAAATLPGWFLPGGSGSATLVTATLNDYAQEDPKTASRGTDESVSDYWFHPD
jgi:hypothetical protein